MCIAVLADVHGNAPALRAVLAGLDAGAFWLLVVGGVPQLRETPYDLDAAGRKLRATRYPDVDSLLAECLLAPVDPEWAATFFEHGAGRGADPGPPPA